MIFHIVAVTAILALAESAKFPSNWTKCPKTNNEECLKKAIEVAIKDMRGGKRSLSAVPLEPLHFDRMELNQGGKSPVAINLTFYDLDLIGSTNSHARYAKADWDNYEIEFEIAADGPATLVGDYTIGGKVLVLPIRGQGKANVTYDNFRVLIKLKGSEVMKNNKKYMHVDDCAYIINTSKAHFSFSNLFDGVRDLGDNMNAFLNENWREILGELNGTISAGVGLGIKQVANAVLNKIPVTDLYI